jgi:hypothetical protein
MRNYPDSTNPMRKDFLPPTTQNISIEQGLDYITSKLLFIARKKHLRGSNNLTLWIAE